MFQKNNVTRGNKNFKTLFILFVFILGFNQAFAYYDEINDKSFKDGFEAGLKALEFQAKTEGNLVWLNQQRLLQPKHRH